MSAINEKILLYRLQAKHDPEAFASLYDEYVKRIYRFVFFKVGTREDAEEITSDVFLKTWNYIIENPDTAVKSFSGLLYRIARNTIIDWYRKQIKITEISMGEEMEASDEGKWLEALQNKTEVSQLLQNIKKLKQEYQEVLTLKYVDDLEIAEIAEIVGKGNIAVRVTLHRALKKLKEITER